jgi:hypothetical protein
MYCTIGKVRVDAVNAQSVKGVKLHLKIEMLIQNEAVTASHVAVSAICRD